MTPTHNCHIRCSFSLQEFLTCECPAPVGPRVLQSAWDLAAQPSVVFSLHLANSLEGIR